MKNLKFYNIKKGVALALVTTMLGSFATGCKQKDYPDEEEIISIIHSENGVESNILKYIDIAEKLEKLNLEDYILDEVVSGNPDTPEEIEQQINNYNEKNVTNLRYLKMQEILVNSHIYKTGYPAAYDAAKVATKNYAAEVYGVDDPSSIMVEYYNPNDNNVNNEPVKTVLLNFKTDHGTERISTKNENIKLGAEAMANTQTNSDPNIDDNSLYNSERNNVIKEALIIAESLEQITENENLYDEDLAKKIR